MSKTTKKQWRFEFIVATSEEMKDVQKKINQWKSTGLYIKHDKPVPSGTGEWLFQIALWKTS